MKILMLTSETVPFAKSGGLADMVSALSSALRVQGHDVRILLPLYDLIPRVDLKKLTDTSIDMVHRHEEGAFYEGRFGEVPVYFLESDKYFCRKGIYGPTPASSYPDNAHRYSLLSRSFIELCRHLGWYPEILHTHDWPTATACLYLNREEDFSDCATVFSIHNMGYQGTYGRTDLPWMGMDVSALHDYHMLKDGYMNFLKTGIENNDMITTVSPNYAREIRTLSYGEGLDQSLNFRKENLRGILNGVDYTSWNPESDTLIAPDNYGYFDLSGKKACKKRLQIRMGLPEDAEIPLFAMITRLVSQKGIEELCRPGYGILEDFCREREVQLVILGTGEPWCEEELSRLSSEIPNLSVRISYNEELSHLIEAGADFFMMPSRYEPCGLNQLYSLKYGTLPIVRRTGGLADSVRDPQDEGENRATGFVFDNADPLSFRVALNRAVDSWEDNRDLIRHMRIRGMREDFSWTESARSYAAVYEEALQEKRNRRSLPSSPSSSNGYDENLFLD